jgi:uncharacterized protein (DUF983 family)
MDLNANEQKKDFVFTFARIMLKPGQKLYSIFRLKCPECHKGDLFVNQNPYSMKDFFEMPKRCSNCNLKYDAEPGFFFGAMFVSYALSIIVAGFTWALLTILSIDFLKIIWAIVVVLILAIPVIFKLSRAIWLNFFFHFRDAGKH